MTKFETLLSNYTESDWLTAVEDLLPSIHEVDRNAVRIWFRFYPLSLKRFIDAAEDRDATLHGIAMLGEYSLETQIDSSHHFLYGHRYWKEVKAAVEDMAATFDHDKTSIAEAIVKVANAAAAAAKTDATLTTAIAAVGLATLNQVGIDAFKAASGDTEKPTGIMAKSPDAIVTERKTDDSQGVFGFLKTVNKKYSVAYAAKDYAGKFPLLNEQELSAASANDQSRNWKQMDERCWEGPVPVECTSASCGTCWVGVLGGQEKLTPVQRRERRQMKVFGYNQPDDETPLLRLACQARAEGNVTLVIPPWNAVFGKKVYGNIEEVELAPNTTSAAKLRETIATAISGE
jgi:ferredoxin